MKVLKFYADWCGPCKMLSKAIEGADVNLEIVNVDIDDDSVLTMKYGVRGVPMCVVVDEDGKELRRKVGMMSKDEFEKFVRG